MSNYAKQVLKLLKRLYTQPIQKEVSVGKITKPFRLSEETLGLIKTFDCKLNRLRLDFYIPGIIAVEVQGEQHEKPVKFSNEVLVDEALIRRKGLDSIKQNALMEAGIPFICVWWYEIGELNERLLKEKIETAQEIADKAKVVEDKQITFEFKKDWKPKKLKSNSKFYRPKGKPSKLSKDWANFKSKRGNK